MKLFFEDKRISKSWRFDTLTFPPHLHQAIEIGYLLEGSCLVRVEGIGYHINAGDIFVIFPNLVHSYEDIPRSAGCLSIIAIDDLAPYAKTITELVPLSPHLPKGTWENTGLPELICRLFLDLNKESPEVIKGYYRVIFGKLLPLLSLTGQVKKLHSALRDILTYLNAHASEDITRKTLAKTLGLSESTISHIFSETLKISLPDYLSALRLNQAIKLLEETDLNVTEIASISGFGSIRSFNRVFKGNYMCSPTEYRKNISIEHKS